MESEFGDGRTPSLCCPPFSLRNRASTRRLSTKLAGNLRRVITARPPPLGDRAGNNVLDDSIHTRIRGSRVRPHPEPTERRLRRLAHRLMGCSRDPSLVEHMIKCKPDRVARLQERRIRWS